MKNDPMLLELLKNRRSIRKYQQTAVEPEKIDKLIEAALRSPSSRGLNPWEFVVVTDPIIIEKLSTAKPHGASFLKKAPLAIVICADTTRSDVWIEDTSIATLILHLTAADLGLGSCWIQLRLRSYNEELSSEAYVRQLLDLKKHIAVLAIMAIGYPAEEKAPRAVTTLAFEKIHYGHFGVKQPDEK
ncbi:MAG: nitroreductase family protein [Desulfobacteraceae bacterium]|jgi:nitroreductase